MLDSRGRIDPLYRPLQTHLPLFRDPSQYSRIGTDDTLSPAGRERGYIVMCQISISFAAGTSIICDEIVIMAAASHQHVAVVLAVLGMFSNVGGAVGLTVAAAIWQHVFPHKLAAYLPTEELENSVNIYADITVQLSYPVGSETRMAIQHAYGDVQQMTLIAGTAVWVVGLVAVLMWRDIRIIGIKQVKGYVF